MIGHVGGEIGVAAVGLDQRAVHVVAERGRAEQKLLAVLPLLIDLPLRRRQPTRIDEAVRFEVGDGFGDLIARPVDQGALREEHVVVDAELAEIFLDHGEHGGECRVAHDRQPFALRQAKQLASVLLDEQGADRLQIVAWIEAFRNLADVFPERLPVAEVG